MNLATMLPVLQRNQTISNVAANLLTAPFTAWSRMSGVSMTGGRIKVDGINRQLTNAIGDDDSPPEDDPIAAPAVCNDVALTVSGDWQIQFVLSIDMDQDLHVLLYGVVPMVQDEWQNDNNMLDIEINVWDEDPTANTATLWWTSYNKNSGTKEGSLDFNSGATAGTDLINLIVKKVGTTYTITVNNKQAGSWTVADANSVFLGPDIYFSFFCDAVGQTCYVTAINATAIGTGSSVKRRNMGAPWVVRSENSLRNQVELNYPNTTIGTCVASHPLSMDRQYAPVLGRDFNEITPENCMKFQLVEPQQGVYEFGEADVLVEFAQKNNIRIHGHCLVWFNSNPEWLTKGTFTNAQIQTIMENHIAALVGRYKGKIAAWDVINEPFIEWTANLHASPWNTAMGSNYITLALQAAHTADPDALLFINEWGCEAAGDKQDALYNLCSSLLTAGVPLHGVGFQMHEDMNDPDFQADTPDQGSVSPAELRTAIQRFKALGLQVRVSEMDVNLHSIGPNTVQAQGDYFRDMMEVCIEEQARSFTMWGFTDKWTSLQEWTEYYQYGNGVIFDTSYNPKIAYNEILARLKQPPT